MLHSQCSDKGSSPLRVVMLYDFKENKKEFHLTPEAFIIFSEVCKKTGIYPSYISNRAILPVKNIIKDESNIITEIQFSTPKKRPVWINELHENLIILEPRIPKSKEEGKIAYNKLSKKSDGRAFYRRVQITINKFLSRQLKIINYLPSAKIAYVSDIVTNILYGNSQVSYIKGKSITEAYRKAIGNTSCMTGSDRCRYTKLYEKNPKKIQMAIYKQQKGGSARAIIWELDNGKIYADRIFYNSSYAYEVLREEFRKKGWLSYDLGDTGSKLVVSGLSFKSGEIPYLDSFRTADIVTKNGKDTLTVYIRGDGDYGTTTTRGVLEKLYHNCFCCKKRIKSTYIMWRTYKRVNRPFCEKCYHNVFVCCSHCGDTYMKDDTYNIDGKFHCEHCRHPNVEELKSRVFLNKVRVRPNADGFLCLSW